MVRILFFSLLFLIACSNTPTGEIDNEERLYIGGSIEGTWRVSGMFDDGFSWFSEYSFESGRFTMQGYPPIEGEGSYVILSQDDDTFVLEMDPVNQEPYEAIFILSNDGETLEWNQQIYTRVN